MHGQSSGNFRDMVHLLSHKKMVMLGSLSNLSGELLLAFPVLFQIKIPKFTSGMIIKLAPHNVMQPVWQPKNGQS